MSHAAGVEQCNTQQRNLPARRLVWWWKTLTALRHFRTRHLDTNQRTTDYVPSNGESPDSVPDNAKYRLSVTMSNFPYQELDPTKNEIRILRFVDAAKTASPHLVHCTLHHVSLDDLLPEFSDYLLEIRCKVTPYMTKCWLQKDSKHWVRRKLAHTPHVAAWRYYNEDHSRVITFSELAAMDKEEQATSSNPMNIKTSKRRTKTRNVTPRFNWGDFEAISYCWESDVREKDVIVNDVRVQIPRNLEALLQRLQHLPDARSGMGFWIDGLCISQDDLLEKNHQVHLMGRIYSQALGVIVWLGEGSDTSIEAIDTITELADLHSKYVADDLDRSQVELQIKSRPGPLRSILELWSRNYFTRMWVIQELALNLHMSMFMCGEQRIARGVIQRVATLFQEFSGCIEGALIKQDRDRTSAPDDPQHDVWQKAYNIENLITLDGSVQPPLFETVLDLARKSSVKHPEDKIFGLLGLLPDNLAGLITPDYSKNMTTVFFEFASTILEKCTHLDEILSWCAFEAQSPLPSWVPDWTRSLDRYHIRWFRRFRACGDLAPRYSLCKDSYTLHTSGLCVDIIDSASLPCAQVSAFMTPPPSRAWHSISSKTYGRYGDEPGLRDALYRTLMHAHPVAKLNGSLLSIYWVDWGHTNDPKTHQLRRALGENSSTADPWLLFDCFRQSNSKYSMFGHSLQSMFPYMDQHDHVDQNCVEEGIFRVQRRVYPRSGSGPPLCGPTHDLTAAHKSNMRLATVALKGRRLITTKTGYLGLAPDEIQVGDIIAVLYGCNYPVVLRKHESGFKYVGECYIDGLMFGEAITCRDSGEYHEEQLAII